jgi:hypothetical protein
MRINAHQCKIALENMTEAWAAVPEEHSLLMSRRCSFFDDPQIVCRELLTTWHSGRSPHPDKDDLKNTYRNNAAGLKQLVKDVMALRLDPCLSQVDDQLSAAKFKKQDERAQNQVRKKVMVAPEEVATEALEDLLSGTTGQKLSGLMKLAQSGRAAIAKHIERVDRCLADEDVTVRKVASWIHLEAPLKKKPGTGISLDGKQFTSSGKPVPPTHWGITKQQVRHFYEEFKQVVGWHRMTAREMVQKYLRPKYNNGRSVALQYNDSEPLPIECVVSHSWDENAKEFLEDLLRAPLPETRVLFICFLCVYQGTDNDIDLQVTQGSDDVNSGCFAKILRHV